MEIFRFPVLKTNYTFVLYDASKKITAVVDPAVAQPVLALVQDLDAQLVAIFNTHHHADHVGGNRELIGYFPELCIYGGAEDRGRIPKQQIFLHDGDPVHFGDRAGEVLFVPGHTRAHIAYYFPPLQTGQLGDLFCGDTLFAGGCGRLFEGTPAQMVQSLAKLRSLPDTTRVWCAHEYTLNNLEFALTVDPHNAELQTRYIQVRGERDRQQPTVPSLLGVEKKTNPFLRWDSPEIQRAMATSDPIRTFARLRGRKDCF